MKILHLQTELNLTCGVTRTISQIIKISSVEFGLSKIEAEIISGWRELFYGDKNKSRIFWKYPFKYFSDDKRIPIVFLLSYFPIQFVNYILELRIKHRIKSFLKF